MTDEPLDFVMEFVSNSEKFKDQYLQMWEEVLASHSVIAMPQVMNYGTLSQNQNPYKNQSRYGIQDQIVLKDPETHQVVMTYVSKLAKAIFGDPDGKYVTAQPSGWEDWKGAETVTKLERYAFALEGSYRTMIEALTEMCCIGTSVIEVGYKYIEREVPVRSVTSSYGIDQESTTRQMIPAYDDVCMRVVPLEDFYPDPSVARIEDMSGAVKRFTMTAIRARALGEQGVFDKKMVQQAIESADNGYGKYDQSQWREGVDMPTSRESLSSFGTMTGYEYWGEVPWIGSEDSSRRVITVLSNVVVRDRPFPYADYCLPFHSFIINPMTGRFYGLAPAEVIRYDQDFADALKMLLAEAVVRAVHPPIAFDPDRMESQDVSMLRRWKADMPVAISGGPANIGPLHYDVNLSAAFSMLAGLKQSMQQGSGAPGAIQGEGMGTKRLSASEASLTYAAAMDEPELAGLVLERECLPQIGKAVLRRYQQFLTTEGLRRRVGEMPEPVWIGDIMGEFDMIFTGSRQMISAQAKLQAWDRLAAMAASVPGLQMMLPTGELAKALVGDLLKLPEAAMQVGNPQAMQANVAAMMAAGRPGQSGNGNGVPPAAQPAGIGAEQALGGPIGAG